MASRAQFIAGLDIGTSKTTVSVGHVRSDGTLEIIGYGKTASRGLRKGVVVHIEATVQSIMEAVGNAERMAGLTIKSVIASISGTHLKGINSNGIVPIRQKEVKPQDVEKVIETAKAVIVPTDREILHVIPQEFMVDDQDGIRDPRGISGVRLEARVHIVTGATATAQNIIKCANRCGISVQDVVMAPLATGNSVLSSEEQELGVCLLELGAGTCSLAVFQGGAIRHTSVLPVGGNHITNDLSVAYRISLTNAEEVKCAHGVALLSLADRSEVVDTSGFSPKPSKPLTKGMIAEVIEPRVHEILTMAKAELYRSGFNEHSLHSLVVTGGGALLQGFPQSAESILELPVRLGYPQNVTGLSEIGANPECACVTGLLYYGSKLQSGTRSGTSRESPPFFKRIVGWFDRNF
jgi:cell division protein FtsA